MTINNKKVITILNNKTNNFTDSKIIDILKILKEVKIMENKVQTEVKIQDQL